MKPDEIRVSIAPRPPAGHGLDLIREPGPARANAIAAAQASLRTHVGLCGDRARAAATFAVDAAVDAAQRTDDDRRARADREGRS